MKTYTVEVQYKAVSTIIVHANSEEDAIKQAEYEVQHEDIWFDDYDAVDYKIVKSDECDTFNETENLICKLITENIIE